MKTQSMIKLLTLLLTLPLIHGCGGPATSDAKLSVSSSFITAGGTSAGGFIVMGESATKKFVLSLTGTNEGKVKLEKGVWKFTAVGWDGAQPFEGNTLCGSVPSVDLSSDASSVEIKVDAASCSNAVLSSEINIRTLSTISCDIFYQYDQSSNNFAPLTSSFSPSFCGSSMPNDYRSDFTRFRYQSLNFRDGIQAPGFLSECKDLTVPTSLNLPTSKIPLLVKFYKNADDCTNNRASQNYLFKDGISLGSPNFDQKLNSSSTMLLLSSARTKRGTSPFMNEIPRINCGTYGAYSDCFAEPVVDGHINVPFHGSNYGEQIVLKGVAPTVTACTPAIMNSKFYFTETCKVDEGRVKIQPQRNELLCQATPFYQSGFNIKDMYFRGNKLYILRRDTGVYKDFVAVYNLKGKKLVEYDLGSVDLSKFAVSTDGSKIVGYSTSQLHTFTIAGNSITALDYGFSGISNIELHPDGTYIYAAYGNLLKAYNFTGTMMSQQSLTNSISQLNIGGGSLYAVESGNNAIHKTALSSIGAIGSDFVPAQGTLPSDIQTMTVTDASKIYYHNGTGLGSSVDLINFTAPVIDNTGSSTPVGMAMIEDKLYLANVGGLYVLSPTTGNPISANTGNCAESVTFTLGGTSKTLSVVAHQNQPLNPLYNEAYNLIGRTMINETNFNFYYFQSLAHNDDGVRTGGKLERIQEMLSPEALGGFLSGFATCTDVKAAAPFTKNHTFIDESRGEIMDFTLAVTAPTTDYMSSYICNDSDSLGSGCTPSPAQSYDLVLNFTHNGTDGREKMRIKLKCGEKKGSFESADVEFSPSEIRNELLLWNTNLDNKARFERYSLDQDSQKRAEIVRLEKSTADALHARTVQVELNGSNKSGSISEFEITASDIFTGRFHVSDTLTSFNAGNATNFLGKNYSLDNVVNNQSFFDLPSFAEAPAFTTRANTNINGTTSSGGNFSDITDPAASKGFFLSISNLNIDDSSNPMVLNPGEPGAVFELQP